MVPYPSAFRLPPLHPSTFLADTTNSMERRLWGLRGLRGLGMCLSALHLCMMNSISKRRSTLITPPFCPKSTQPTLYVSFFDIVDPHLFKKQIRRSKTTANFNFPTVYFDFPSCLPSCSEKVKSLAMSMWLTNTAIKRHVAGKW